MQIEAQTTVARQPAEVFDYLAHAEYLPEYVTDFATVSQVSEGEPRVGTQYSYRMARGQAEGTFEWTRFEPDSQLAWHGPAAHVGLGSMQPAGWWELAPEAGGTRVKLVMAPKPAGLLKLLAPLLAAGMRSGNAKALERLKQRLEGGTAATDPV
jgi:uncharacterized protein YndB with AHSA1/START domain